MAWFWWLLGVLIIVLWIAAVVDIIRKRNSRTIGKTIAWILLIIIIPIVGTIIYFLVRLLREEEAKEAALADGEPNPPS